MKYSELPIKVQGIVYRQRRGGDVEILLLKRSEEDGGFWQMLTGTMEMNESVEECLVRELWEETGVRIDPAGIELFRVMSAPDGTLLVFGLAPGMGAADLPLFAPLPETMERVILMEAVELAFPLHTAAVKEWFEQLFL